MTRNEEIKAKADAIAGYAGRWRKIKTPDGRIRVMAVVEGYVVARYNGAMPFLEHVNNWRAVFEPAVPDASEANR